MSWWVVKKLNSPLGHVKLLLGQAFSLTARQGVQLGCWLVWQAAAQLPAGISGDVTCPLALSTPAGGCR